MTIKTLIILCIISVVAYCTPIFNEEFSSEWKLFKRVHSKQYNSVEEELTRRGIWEANLAKIQRHNVEADMGIHTFTLGMNQFGDMTNEEFRKQMNGLKIPVQPTSYFDSHIFLPPSNFVLPAAVDWRKEGYVTPIKNQGQCGSCYAFSAVGALEGQHYAKTRQLVSLSEQNLIDCTRQYGNIGCYGGWMNTCFQYVRDNQGIDTESSYPYEGAERDCRFREENIGATNTGYVTIAQGNEHDLQTAIATVGPIAIAVDASQDSFRFYKSGVYHEQYCSKTRVTHAVLAVGYDARGSEEYYIIKNSWGTWWGQEGYIWMARNRDNECGIANMASYPLV